MSSRFIRINHFVGYCCIQLVGFLVLAVCVLSIPAKAQTTERQSVPGTWCSLVVPEGWVSSKRMKGFEHKASGSSLLFSLQASDFESNRKVLSEENFKKQGMKLVDSREMMVEGRPAVFYRFDHDRKGKPFVKQMVLLGDQFRTISVSTFCPASDSLTINAAFAALMTVKYDPADYSNLTGELPFQITFEGTGLKPVIQQGSGLVYTSDGYFPTRSEDKATFLSGQFNLKDTVGDLQSIAIRKIKSINGVDTLAAFESEPVTIDSLNGFVVRSKGTFADGKPQLVYAVVLFMGTSQVYILAGMANGQATRYSAVFQKMTASFSRR